MNTNPLSAIPPLARSIIYLTLLVAGVFINALALMGKFDGAAAAGISAGIVSILGALAAANVTKNSDTLSADREEV